MTKNKVERRKCGYCGSTDLRLYDGTKLGWGPRCRICGNCRHILLPLTEGDDDEGRYEETQRGKAAAYWVIESMANSGNSSGGRMLRARKAAGPYAGRAEAERRADELRVQKKAIYENRDLPGEVRKQAMETTYQVWTDEYIEEARRAGVQI